jgi:Fur family ferric uptake transcriptional regulator
MVLSAGDNRLVCRQCGRTEEVGCAIGDQPCLTLARAAGFTVDEAEVVFLGLCPACKTGEVTPGHRMNRS